MKSSMKIKRLIAVCIACIMLVAMVPTGVGRGVEAKESEDGKASNVYFDGSIWLELDAKFYVGYKVGDLLHSSYKDYYPIEKNPKNVIRTKEKIVEKVSGKELSSDDVLKDGIEYTYYITLESYATDGSTDYDPLGAFGTKVNYECIDVTQKMYKFSYTEYNNKAVKTEAMSFYALNIDKAPSADLGELTLDVSSGEIILDSEKSWPVFYSFSSARDYGFISYVDGDMWDYIYDLNKDGTADIEIDGVGKSEQFTLKKTENCSVKSKITLNLTEEGKKILNTHGITYYGSLTIVFSEEKSADNPANNLKEEKKDNGSSIGGGSANSSDQTAKKNVYKNEWVNGQWYDANGGTSYTAKGQWKNDESGWWFEDESGWYSKNQWLRIDGKWYFFTEAGYMDYSEYRDGCWLNADGSWDENYSNGTWHQDSNGWWFEDAGWYPQNQYLWIDGVNYWFDADGYCK